METLIRLASFTQVAAALYRHPASPRLRRDKSGGQVGEPDLRYGPHGANLIPMRGIAEIARECLELPVSQRLRLVRVLLDVSEPDMDELRGVEEAWDDEIGARIEAVRNGLAGSQSVEELWSEIDHSRPA